MDREARALNSVYPSIGAKHRFSALRFNNRALTTFAYRDRVLAYYRRAYGTRESPSNSGKLHESTIKFSRHACDDIVS